MKTTVIAVTGMIVLLVIAYLAYDLLKGKVSPCETVFEQTSVMLGAKMKVIKNEGAVFVGREKVQDLTEAAQLTALNLKTCCITLNAGKLNANQFLQCKDSARTYEAKVDAVVAHVQEAVAAKQAGKTDVLQKKLSEITTAVEEAKSVSREFEKAVGALSKTSSVTKEREPGGKRAPQDSSTFTPATKSALRPWATLSGGTEPLKSTDVNFYVYEAKQNIEGNRRKVTQGYGIPEFDLPAGRYIVEAQYGSAHARVEVEVKAGNRTDHALNLNAGYLRTAAILGERTEPLKSTDVDFFVYEAKQNIEGNRRKVTQGYGIPQFVLPAGRYFVEAKYGSAHASTEVDVKAGERTEHTLILNAGYLRTVAILGERTEPLKSTDVDFFVYEAKQNVEGNRQKVTQGYGIPRFVLPAGRYFVEAKYGSAHASTEVDVKAGERTEHTLVLNAGYLRTAAILGEGTEPLKSTNVDFYVYEARQNTGGDRRKVTQGYGIPQFVLPAGRYFVEAKYGSAHASTEVDVKAGERTEHTLILNAGYLKTAAILGEGTEPLKSTNVDFYVYEAKQNIEGNRRKVTQGYGIPQFVLPAARYFVEAKYGSAYASAEVEVKVAERKDVTLRLKK